MCSSGGPCRKRFQKNLDRHGMRLTQLTAIVDENVSYRRIKGWIVTRGDTIMCAGRTLHDIERSLAWYSLKTVKKIGEKP